MKKSALLILGLLVSSVILSSLVYAADAGTNNIVTSIGGIVESVYQSGVEPLAGFLIGKTSAGNATKFFTLILILVLLVSVFWEITERVPFIGNNSWVQFIVSFSIALISVRFLGEAGNSAWFETILLPNQALGIALMCLFPFIIYFFFVMDVGTSSPTLAKILWIFASVLFAILYFSRVDEIGAQAGGKFNPANVYLLAAFFSLLFLFADGTIRRYAKKIEIEKTGKTSNDEAMLELRRRLNQLDRDLSNGAISPDEHRKYTKKLKDKLMYLMKV